MIRNILQNTTARLTGNDLFDMGTEFIKITWQQELTWNKFQAKFPSLVEEKRKHPKVDNLAYSQLEKTLQCNSPSSQFRSEDQERHPTYLNPGDSKVDGNDIKILEIN